jgi:hypothetical protein
MKRIFISIIVLLSVLSINSKSYSQEEFPDLEGPYLGQKPPGMVAEPFALGIISKEGWELEGVFAPDMKEFYFTTRGGKYTSPTVIGFRQQSNVWKKYIEFTRSGEVVLSPDGTRMHMAKGYKDRLGDGWSELKSLGPMFDREDWGIMRLSASAKGTYVFDDYKSNDVIRISTLKDGKRQAPIQMGPIVNTGKWTAHPFIAPDESYLIWDSERKVVTVVLTFILATDKRISHGVLRSILAIRSIPPTGMPMRVSTLTASTYFLTEAWMTIIRMWTSTGWMQRLLMISGPNHKPYNKNIMVGILLAGKALLKSPYVKR